jgi:hypothetical protein
MVFLDSRSSRANIISAIQRGIANIGDMDFRRTTSGMLPM